MVEEWFWKVLWNEVFFKLYDGFERDMVSIGNLLKMKFIIYILSVIKFLRI